MRSTTHVFVTDVIVEKPGGGGDKRITGRHQHGKSATSHPHIRSDRATRPRYHSTLLGYVRQGEASLPERSHKLPWAVRGLVHFSARKHVFLDQRLAEKMDLSPSRGRSSCHLRQATGVARGSSPARDADARASAFRCAGVLDANPDAWARACRSRATGRTDRSPMRQ